MTKGFFNLTKGMHFLNASLFKESFYALFNVQMFAIKDYAHIQFI